METTESKTVPFKPLVSVALVLILIGGAQAIAERAEPEPNPISGSSLIDAAAAQYDGEGLRIEPGPDGTIQMLCRMQRLSGEVLATGLWLTSTDDQLTNRFQIKATHVGRDGGTTLALAATGRSEWDPDVVRFIRAELVEEYSVSVQGLRQDLIVSKAPQGSGRLRVELAAQRARVEADGDGIALTLEGSNRRLRYDRLRVIDAEGKELAAHFESVSAHRLAVVVDDVDATYPVRIDPTFSDANWISLGGLPGANQKILSATFDGSGNLYVGGTFTLIGTAQANRIAKWDGTSWSALGSGMNNEVNALAASGSDLYAGGFFTTAGGVSANRIAKWDGTSWSALGSGMDAVVYSLSVSGSDLHAGGAFTTAGGVSANRIAKWDGTSWSALGSGMNNDVLALVVSGSDLYAGGVSASHVAQWDGTSWSTLGSGMSSWVLAFAVSGSDLYAGGHFSTAGGVSANWIAKWDGTSWSALGSGMDADVDALVVSESDLYAGGDFTTAGGISANRIAKWNGTTWSAIGSGVDNRVRALTASATDLYLGGDFQQAGGKISAFVARAQSLVAEDSTSTRAPGAALKIPISDVAGDLLFGNPVSVQSLGASAQGASLAFNANYIFYQPANNNQDSFTYTVSNGGGTTSGTLTVNVAASGGLAKTLTVSGGNVTVKFFGIPGVTYHVQRTTNLTEPVTWTTLTSTALSPGTDGSFSYTDSSAPDGTAYYRSLSQ